MSTAEQPDQPEQPRVQVYPPEQALRRAWQPLPRREDLVIEDVPEDAWDAFDKALAEA